ncbi:MAG: triosephosphate isomerase [Saprospiraceae bacterium]|jgi:triosephosphate isomerase
MRQNIVAGNWKMNKDFQEGLDLVKGIIENTNPSDTQVVLCTPFIHLQAASELAKDVPNVAIAAQNCYTKSSGAYTGETSVPMLKSIGVEYVVIGHSERREYFNESHAFLAEKVNVVLENGLLPIFCCGESLDIRQAGTFVEYVATQLKESLFHLSAEDFGKVVVAYEPIWAIGTGVTASREQAQETQAALRQVIAEKYGEAVADDTTILYGGSVKPANAVELFGCADVDGGLVGGASLTVENFIPIIKAFN